MRDRLELLLALGIGIVLAALPFLHYGFGGAHDAGAHHHTAAHAVAIADSPHH